MNKKPVCQVGDLAIIIKSPRCPENIGKIVKVVSEAVDGSSHNTVNGEAIKYLKTKKCISWVVQTEGSPLTVRTETGNVYQCFERVYADEYLFPIRDKQPAQSTDKQTEKETT